MNLSSYLLATKRKIQQLRSMEKLNVINKNNSTSDISIDSLERDVHEKEETILVPFYENDVLMKVPIVKKEKQVEKKPTQKVKSKQEPEPSYLINKTKKERLSYLQRFRKQISKGEPDVNHETEVCSVAPEFGDTEMESFLDDSMRSNDILNTEAYNEMFYDNIMHEQHLTHYLDEALNLDEISNSDNLKSVSEIAPPRRVRRTTHNVIHSIKLGGLGPDLESIKPRLERAKSLQRYSDKVRQENMSKMTVKKPENNNDQKKKSEKKSSHMPKTVKDTVNRVVSKVVNKPILTSFKNLSAKEPKTLSKEESQESIILQKTDVKPDKRASRGSNADAKCKTYKANDKPVEIKPSVAIGARPSSALRNMEEKHRMYQEQVKAFKMTTN